MILKPLNIFYAEPDPDRWVKFDRYPRKFIRRIVRGETRPGGVMMVALNLMKGLDRLNFPYHFNNYKYIKKHPKEIACIIGKPHVLFDRKWSNPVILGAGIYSHPIECPDLLIKYPNVKRILVPGEWMRQMFEPYYGSKVLAWPTGIDTDIWSPLIRKTPEFDFLIYDKIRWEHADFEQKLIQPICKVLDKHSLSYRFIRYGSYQPKELISLTGKCKAVVFLCEHETQGLAYQQILATGTPILAWDQGGYWQDPYYYPHKVKYAPISSVPYWDDRCGLKFTGLDDFEMQLARFLKAMPALRPRDYILENLTLTQTAEKYVNIYEQVYQELA